MRIKIDNVWVAGHPDYEAAMWTPAQGAMWLPTRGGSWESGAGWERVGYEDAGNPAFSLSFSVQRCFETQREVAEFLTRLHSLTPPHPWAGAVVVRYDDEEEGGSVEIDLGQCVMQLAGPVTSLGETARLTVNLNYLISGGVTGDQPVYTDPEDPEQYPYEDAPIPYES